MEPSGVVQDSQKAEKRRIALTVFLLIFFGILASFFSTAVVPRLNQIPDDGHWIVPVFSKVVFRFHDAVRANLFVFWILIVGSVALLLAKGRLVSNRAAVRRLNRAGVVAAYVVLTGYLVVTVIAMWLPKEVFGVRLT